MPNDCVHYLCLGYTSDPHNVPFCQNRTVPTMFTVTCQFNSTSFLPNWLVTGLSTMSDQTIYPSVTTGPFIPKGRVGESTLTVNSQEVTVGTCFQCAITLISGSVPIQFRSMPGCVTAVGE